MTTEIGMDWQSIYYDAFTCRLHSIDMKKAYLSACYSEEDQLFYPLRGNITLFEQVERELDRIKSKPSYFYNKSIDSICSIKYDDSSFSGRFLCGSLLNALITGRPININASSIQLFDNFDWLDFTLLIECWRLFISRGIDFHNYSIYEPLLPSAYQLEARASLYCDKIEEQGPSIAINKLCELGFIKRTVKREIGWFFAKENQYNFTRLGWEIMTSCTVVSEKRIKRDTSEEEEIVYGLVYPSR